MGISVTEIPRNRLYYRCVGFNGVRRGSYFRGEPIRGMEVEARVGKPKNGKAAGKDDITGEMIKGGGEKVVD